VYKKEQDAVVASCQALGGAARSLKLGATGARPRRATNPVMSFNNGDFLSKVDPQWLSAPASQPPSISQLSNVHPMLSAAAANATGVPSSKNITFADI
tara:strand:- start:449 stop:742 length:294 start_codon:yes stop_codon:yes gene_type:complete